MRKMLISLFYIFIFTIRILSKDISGLSQIYSSEDFVFFAEDNNDYSELIDDIEMADKRFQKLFDIKLNGRVEVFIFKNRTTFSKSVFNIDTPYLNISAFSDYKEKKFYVTSFYSDPENLERYKKIPVHELVHLYLPNDILWLREGVACYYSNMLYDVKLDNIPCNIEDFGFYTDSENTIEAYNLSSWLVKYVIEELCDNDFNLFIKYFNDPVDYSIIGVKNEMQLMQQFKEYLKGIFE